MSNPVHALRKPEVPAKSVNGGIGVRGLLQLRKLAYPYCKLTRFYVTINGKNETGRTMRRGPGIPATW